MLGELNLCRHQQPPPRCPSRIKYVVTLGQGCGSNVLARFSMAFPNRVIGNVLMECTLAEAGVMELLADKVTNIRMPINGFYPSAADFYLFLQKYGGAAKNVFLPSQLEKMENQEKIQIKELPPQKPPPRGLNHGNLRQYIEAFLKQLARLETLKAQEKDKARYDSKHEAMDYNVGDLVWIFIPIRKVGLSEKLMKRYFGSYRVTRKLSNVTFEVEPVDQPTRRRQTRDLVHVLRMKPYHDPEDQADLFK
ncbi:hypothetical protein LAZ67_6000125 [Cordylochernes scorpioides]|uniref:Integrase p58-like C-terminal domain-containing protein n=1 Tax=Cordylochernes scorpioides TaxID=51811 RepID=A0ABY6KI76_9ARAC|nr:hypothetical protein LAZ67_6000125 [Cordylochernes scorpioides]